MSEKDLFKRLLKEYPDLIYDRYPFPEPYIGDGQIKAIVLGADPTHIIDGAPKTLHTVFGLNSEGTPYWNSIWRNIEHISNLSMSNLYVQNVCRNYFTRETSQNKKWLTIARNYWIPYLKIELNNQFDKEIPILMTTEFILNSSLINKEKKIKAKDIYSKHIVIVGTNNLFHRSLLAFYRHPRYSLKNWPAYQDFIASRL